MGAGDPDLPGNSLDSPVEVLPGVGPKRAAELGRYGLRTVADLVFHLPFRYDDRRVITPVADLRPGADATALVEVTRMRSSGPRWGRGRGGVVEASAADATGTVTLIWFNVPRYFSQQCQPGRRLLVHGRVDDGPKIVHPEIDVVPERPAGEAPGPALDHEVATVATLRPVYGRPGGLSAGFLRRFVRTALEASGGAVTGAVPEDALRRLDLMPIRAALAYAHAPPRDADLEALNMGTTPAQRSLIFDELFCFQLALLTRRAERLAVPGIPFGVPGPRAEALRRELPFSLTGAQERVLAQIYADMAAPRPMRRLVQGDVGSGKTLVALFAALAALDEGCSAAVMAPTEVLAEQHAGTFRELLEPLGMAPLLLTGGVTGRARAATLEALASGAPQLVVGTQALIQSRVAFARLGLVVVDEQHRFGVLQRERLAGTATGAAASGPAAPDALVMTATPIPRTLAMTVYGDLDVSYVDELPPGRLPIMTCLVESTQRRQAYAEALHELEQGHQVFVVFPLVEEGENGSVRAVTAMVDELRETFAGYPVGLLHGRMASPEKDAAMRDFKDGTSRVLACTTVIEVGVDVPNATVMIVEHADRFGLAQLHQLRGRVGRGTNAATCFLIASEECVGQGYERVQVMEKETDGSRIAEADLRIRGPGEMLGTRQAGLPALRVASLLRDSRLLELARDEARRFLEVNPAGVAAAAVLRSIDHYPWARHVGL
jgi:ATP-dependent DNA helicase RecG